jgi:hypothetical protein
VAEHLRFDSLRGGLAERFLAGVPTGAAQVWILERHQLQQPDSLAHAPARHHPPDERGGLLGVAFGPGGPDAADDLLRRSGAGLFTLVAPWILWA